MTIFNHQPKLNLNLKRKDNIITLIWALFTTIVVVITVLYQMNFMDRDFWFINFTKGGDGYQLFIYIKSLKKSGFSGIYFVDRLGAPDKCSLSIDTGVIDPLHAFNLWIFSLICPSVSYTAIIDYVFTYFTVSLSMFLLLHSINIKNHLNFVFTIVYALAPAHFIRGMGHITVSMYFTVPLGILVALYIYKYGIETTRFQRILLGIFSVLIGIGYPYYAFFIFIVYVISYIIFIIACLKNNQKSPKVLLSKVWVMALTGISLIATRIPSIIYAIEHGKNEISTTRLPFEGELYGLKIINLFVPSAFTRFKFLAKMRDYYNDHSVYASENIMAPLGIIGCIGLILIIVWFIHSFVSRKSEFNDMDFISISTLTMILCCTIGGFGSIFNYCISSQLRCYNRGSFVIACFCIMAIAILLNNIKFKHEIISYVICLSILGVCYYDQVPDKVVFGSNIFEEDSDYRSFFSKIDDEMPVGAMIYELPWRSYPEGGQLYGMADYSEAIGYLYTDDLRWSYGQIKGRDNKQERLNIDDGMSFHFLYEIKKAGFTGVYIDTTAFADGGDEIIEFYSSIGLTPIVSDNGELYFYNISDIDVSDKCLIHGYSYLFDYAQLVGYDASIDEIYDVCESISSGSEDYALTMYEWLADGNEEIDELASNEYIEWLYNNILLRDCTVDEYLQWNAVLSDDLSREGMFYYFVTSEEYRNLESLPLNYVTCSVGDKITFAGDNANMNDYVASGLDYNSSNDEYTCTDGTIFVTRRLDFGIDNYNREINMNVDISGISGQAQTVIVKCNGSIVYNDEVSDDDCILVIPIETDSDGMVEITFEYPELIEESSNSDGESTEDAEVSFAIELENITFTDISSD